MEFNNLQNLKLILIGSLFFLGPQAMAVSVENSIEVKKLTKLAGSGNAIAQYNLAYHYKTGSGVIKNNFTANELLKSATRSGLVSAYLSLNRKAIRSGKGVQLKFQIHKISWLDKQQPRKYTIQLESSRNEKSIKKSYVDNKIEGKGGYYHYVSDGVKRYALVYGVYNSVAAANVAMTELPENLRKKNPWVRKIKSLQNISK